MSRIVWVPVRGRQRHPIIWFWLMAARVCLWWPVLAIWVASKWVVLCTVWLCQWISMKIALAMYDPADSFEPVPTERETVA